MTPENTSQSQFRIVGMKQKPCRHLVLILGDQLDEASAAFDGFDASQDVVLMIEASEESTHVWSHKARTVLFLSAMRHFAEALRQRGWQVSYRALDQQADATLANGLLAAIAEHQPQKVIAVEPGDLRVKRSLDAACKTVHAAIEWREDRHFLCSPARFRHWAGQSSSLRMEFFYRTMRQHYQVLMKDGQPEGGKWNYDTENRKGFGRAGPQNVPRPPIDAEDRARPRSSPRLPCR